MRRSTLALILFTLPACGRASKEASPASAPPAAQEAKLMARDEGLDGPQQRRGQGQGFQLVLAHIGEQMRLPRVHRHLLQQHAGRGLGGAAARKGRAGERRPRRRGPCRILRRPATPARPDPA